MSDKLLSRERYGEAFWRTHARRHVRNTSAQPLIEMMKPWLEMELGRVPPAGPLAEAIRNALARWPALTRFLDDGRIELDNNTVERAIPTCSPDLTAARPAGQSSFRC